MNVGPGPAPSRWPLVYLEYHHLRERHYHPDTDPAIILMQQQWDCDCGAVCSRYRPCWCCLREIPLALEKAQDALAGKEGTP